MQKCACFATQGYATHSYATKNYATQGYATQDYATKNYATQGYANQSYATKNYATQGNATQGYSTNLDSRLRNSLKLVQDSGLHLESPRGSQFISDCLSDFLRVTYSPCLPIYPIYTDIQKISLMNISFNNTLLSYKLMNQLCQLGARQNVIIHSYLQQRALF